MILFLKSTRRVILYNHLTLLPKGNAHKLETQQASQTIKRIQICTHLSNSRHDSWIIWFLFTIRKENNYFSQVHVWSVMIVFSLRIMPSCIMHILPNLHNWCVCVCVCVFVWYECIAFTWPLKVGGNMVSRSQGGRISFLALTQNW